MFGLPIAWWHHKRNAILVRGSKDGELLGIELGMIP